MNKIVRRLSWGIGITVAVIATTLAGIVVFVDPNDFKDDITQAVRDATGRELTLPGDIQLSVFPWLGVTLGKARLSNASGFEEAEFASVESVDIKVKVMPLLERRIEMKTLHLRGLRVNLSRAKDGRSNWDDLTAAPAKTAGDAAEKPKASPAGAEPEGSATAIAALAIGGINIEDAHIRWDDQQAGQQIEVEELSLRLGAIVPREPIDIALSTQLKVSEPALQTPLKLQAQLTIDLQAQHYRVDGVKLSLSLRSDLLPVSPLNAGLTGNVDADLAQQLIKLSELQLKTQGLSINADVRLKQPEVKSQAEGELSIESFSPRDLLKTLGIAAPATADAKVLNKAAVKLAFVGSPEAVSISQLDVRLDDTHLTGSLQARNFSRPALGFDLKIDGIDVDRYLPPTTETPSPPPSPSAAVAASAQLPLDMLRELDVKGDLGLGKLKLAKAQLTDVVLGLTAKGGQLRLSPLQANLYQGQYDGNIALDVRKDTPRLFADEKISAVHVGPLLKDMLGDDKATGTVSVMAKVSASGVTPEAITQSLNGSANFQLADGAVKGVNLGQMIREAYATIKNKPAPPKTSNATDFAEMSGSVTINNGVVHNQDLQAKSPLLRVAGKGQVDLSKQKIKYLLNTSIVETDQGQAGKELDELKAVTIPIKITGSFDKPKFALDLKPVLKAKAEEELKRQKSKLKEKADEKLDKKKEKVKKKLEDKLKNKLKGLF